MINGPKRLFRDTGTDRARPRPGLRRRPPGASVRRAVARAGGGQAARSGSRASRRARLPDGSRLTAAIPPVSSNGSTICTIRFGSPPARSTNCDARLLERRPLTSSPPASSRQEHRRLQARLGQDDAPERARAGDPGERAGRRLRVLGSCSSSPPCELRRLRGASGRPDGLAAITLENLVSDALRMNPDRILVGECRGPETMAMLWSFATGHAGMTSVHGESAEHALQNLVASHSRQARRLMPSRRSIGCVKSTSSSIATGLAASVPARGASCRGGSTDRRGRRRGGSQAHAEPALRRRRLGAPLARKRTHTWTSSNRRGFHVG